MEPHIRENHHGAAEDAHARRLAALEEANRIRIERARLKAELRSGALAPAEVFAAPPECVLTASLAEVLLAGRGIGKVSLERLLRRCELNPAQRIGRLTERQRKSLLAALAESTKQRPVAPPVCLPCA